MDDPPEGGGRKLGLGSRLARRLREAEAKLKKKAKAKMTSRQCATGQASELSPEEDEGEGDSNTPLLLVELPEEVLLPMLEWLDVRDLISVTTVSSSFRRLALDDSLWRAKCRNLESKLMEHTWHQHFIHENGLDQPKLAREMARKVSFVPHTGEDNVGKRIHVHLSGCGTLPFLERVRNDSHESEECRPHNEPALFVSKYFIMNGTEYFLGLQDPTFGCKGWVTAFAVLVVCDLTKDETYITNHLWGSFVFLSKRALRFFVVGNSSDEGSDSQRSAKVIELLDGLRRKYPNVIVDEYIEVSVRTGRNIDLAIKYIAATLQASYSPSWYPYGNRKTML